MTSLINRSELGDACEEVLRTLSQANVRERWFGISADQSGNNWAANRLVPFIVTCGTGEAYGTEIKVVGPDDTPIFAESSDFIIHRLLIVDVDHGNEYKMRIAWGDSTFAAAIAAGQFTEAMFGFAPAIPTELPRQPIDTDTQLIRLSSRVWADIKSVNNGSTVDFYVGLREFDLS